MSEGDPGKELALKTLLVEGGPFVAIVLRCPQPTHILGSLRPQGHEKPLFFEETLMVIARNSLKIRQIENLLALD